MPSVFDPKTSIYSDMEWAGFPLTELRTPVLLLFRGQPRQNFAKIHRKFPPLHITSLFHTRWLTCRHPRNFNTPLSYDNFAKYCHILLCDRWRDDMKAHNFQLNFPKLESRNSIEILRFSRSILAGSSFDHFLTFRCCLLRVGKQGKGVITNHPLEVCRSQLTRPKLNTVEKHRRALCLRTDWTN